VSLKVNVPEMQLMAVESIKPYWRNPRRITQDAVDKVAESIRQYGYVQPIVVDRDHVVIVGHTRLRAVVQLGWTEVGVYVTDLDEAKAKEYRLVDNRTSELSGWDHELLVNELREFPGELLDGFFPNVDLEIGQLEGRPEVTEQQLRNASDKVTRVKEADATATHTTGIVCPGCFHTFQVRTRSLPGLTQEDLDGLASGAAEG
jgi:hypothetical protein